MAKHKYIRCDIYKRGINVFIGTPEELQTWSKKQFDDDDDDTAFNISLKECNYGQADFHYGEGYAILRIPKFPETPKEIAYTVHELFHAACWVLWYCGIEFDNKQFQNEAYSYLIEHLARNTLEKEGYEDV